MKFAFRSGWGESLALARQVESEGNQVRLSIVEPSARSVGRGFIAKSNDWPALVSWADVVVFDGNNFTMPQEAQRAIDAGKKVIGSSALAGQLEHDRLFAVDVAKKAGLSVPEFVEFKGKGAWRKARQFLTTRDDDEGWVWKQNGKDEVAPTYVADGVDEMLRMLGYFETLYGREKQVPDFVMCEKVDGVEVSTEGWFNGKEFVLANHTIERNRLMAGDVGEKTGCAGNVVWLAESALYKALVPPLAATLRGKYWGPIDVNVLIEEDTNAPLFLEFTPRFGYDAVFAFTRLLSSDLGQLFADVAGGRTYAARASGEFAGALRIHTPPYPSSEEHRAEDMPVFGFDPSKVDKGVMPMELMLNPQGEVVTSGPLGVPFVLTKLGATPKEAMDINVNVKVPMMRYRNDLPGAIQEVYDELLDTEWLGHKRRLFGRRA